MTDNTSIDEDIKELKDYFEGGINFAEVDGYSNSDYLDKFVNKVSKKYNIPIITTSRFNNNPKDDNNDGYMDFYNELVNIKERGF